MLQQAYIVMYLVLHSFFILCLLVMKLCQLSVRKSLAKLTEITSEFSFKYSVKRLKCMLLYILENTHYRSEIEHVEIYTKEPW